MRRPVPWLLVGALVLCVGLGALVGVDMAPVGAPPSGARLLARILRATEAAGSARFSFTTDTRSANEYLRSSSAGSGIIDFSTAASETTVVEHSVGFGSQLGQPARAEAEVSTSEAIEVRAKGYLRISAGPAWAGDAPWVRLPGSVAPTPADAARLLERTTDLGLFPPVSMHVARLGPASLDGVAATGYAFTPARQRASRCSPAGPTPRLALGPLDVWVDRSGRLVEARSTFSEDLPRHSLPAPVGQGASGASTTTEVLKVGSYGLAVRLRAPSLQGSAGVDVIGSSGVDGGGTAGCPTTSRPAWVSVAPRVG